MLILRILIYLGVAIFVCCILALGVVCGYIAVKLFPQVRKEDYLMSHGYHCDKGYWCKDDRSIAGDLVYSMNYGRLRDYVDKDEEKIL